MNHLKMGSVVACLAGMSLFSLAGCSDDDEDEGSGGAAGSAQGGSSSGSAGKGGSGKGGSGGSATAGSSGKSGGGSGGASGATSGGSAGDAGAGGEGGSSTPGAGGAGGEAGGDMGEPGGAGGAGGAGDEPARVRVIHLSPDAPGVDVFVNGGEDPAVADLEFPDGTPYLNVPAGTYTFDVAPAGTSADDAVLTIEDLPLEAGASYTAVAYDELASISALALGDDYDGLDAGNIRLRAVHVAAGVGQVDIWNITDAENPAPVYVDLDFGAAGDAVDIPAGAYTLGIDVDDDATPDLTFALPELAAGTVVNAFAVADGADVFLLAQLPDGATARIDPE
jgi:hypothetical protein